MFLDKSPPLFTGDTFQDPQWMPETVNSKNPIVFTIFGPNHIYL